MIITLTIILIFTLLVLINNQGFLYKESGDYTQIKGETVLEGASESIIKNGNSRAILFIHGFPGSPKMYYLVKELAVKSGYDIFIPRLPGMGSDPKYFIESNFSMWYSYVTDMYNKERRNYKKFYIVGNSMGGALTLKLAQELDVKPTAIASVAAPIFLNSIKLRTIKSPILYIVRYLSFFVKEIKKDRVVKPDLDGEREWVGYHGQYPKQTYSLYLALKKIKGNLHKISVPCYLAHAKNDRTVSYKNLDYITKRINSKKQLIRIIDLSEFDHSNHSMFIYKSVVNKLWSDIDYFFNTL